MLWRVILNVNIGLKKYLLFNENVSISGKLMICNPSIGTIE